MSCQIEKSYPLAALLINATNQEVTPEKMSQVFKTLNIEFSSKKASMFCLSAEKYKELMSCTGSAAPAAAPSQSAAAAEPEPEEAKEESNSESIALDF